MVRDGYPRYGVEGTGNIRQDSIHELCRLQEEVRRSGAKNGVFFFFLRFAKCEMRFSKRRVVNMNFGGCAVFVNLASVCFHQTEHEAERWLVYTV